jgi:NAD(P)-dependent dehydrogenase (short-subunit alcohol dehydrogenase family)
MAKSGLTVASLDEVRAVFETNVFGVIAVTQAMLPLLCEAPAGRIVNVSSASGSLTLNSDPNNPLRSMFGTYSSSKTALNAITLAFASALESTGIKVNAACPGFGEQEYERPALVLSGQAPGGGDPEIRLQGFAGA